MTGYVGNERIEKIAAKHKGYEDETRPTCDVNYLLDELKDRDEKLAAVETGASNWSDSRTGWACRADILRILHPKGE